MLIFLKRHTVLIQAGVGVCLFGVGLAVGVFVPYAPPGEVNSELRSGGNGLTNPLLECDIARDTIAARKLDFTPDATTFLSNLQTSYGITDSALYYRDLNNGPIISIGGKKPYSPASLLKVSFLIAYLKWSEDDPFVLLKKFTYAAPAASASSLNQEYPPQVTLEVGKSYTAKELLERMIKYSDNEALALLLTAHMPDKYTQDLYGLVGVDSNFVNDPLASLTTQQYSIFFRVLFNASFLSHTNSEYALTLLTQTTFDDGIRAGVPPAVVVSHKFGERETLDGNEQFHDCGIVYYPKHPYLLCLMMQGGNTQTMVGAIQKASDFVYKKIDSEYGE